ncbi:MAG TPA: hypothetical protein VNN17_11460, partial [Terriglobia bacterium]|nr:hypothetical protein [Terriglobia bacterium]
VTPRGAQASAAEVAHLDRIRREWEQFYNQATSFRSVAGTSLLRALQFAPESVGLFTNSEGTGRIELERAYGADLTVQLSNSNPAAVAVPGEVLIPAGSVSAAFPIAALDSGGSLAEGRAVITASAPGFETADMVVQVAGPQTAVLNMAILSGNHQVASPGSLLPEPLTVLLADSNQIPYAGQNVLFTVLQGDAALEPESARTDARGAAAVRVRLGAVPGAVVIRAAAAGTAAFADFSLTSLHPPAVPALGVLNAASFALSPPFQPGVPTVSPGALISVFGTGLSATTAAASAFPLPSTLGGSSVEIGGIFAPLLYVSPGQINAQVPFPLASGLTTLRVWNTLSASTPIFIAVQPSFPGIFTRDASGSGVGAFLHNDTQRPVTPENPAIPGEHLQMYATGLGAISPPVASGQPGRLQPLSTTVLPVTVTINGAPAPVSFAGLAPGLAGVYQVNIQVPELSPGMAQVVLTAGGVSGMPVALPIGAR